MLTLRLAWRSFVRHRRRSLLTVLAVALGLAMMLVFIGMSDDAHAQMTDMGVRLGSGHVVVQGRGYQEEQTLSRRVAEPGPVLELARALPHVEHVVPRLSASGLLQAGERSRSVLVSGVDPSLEPLVSDMTAERARVAGDTLRAREAMEFPSGPADIFIGKELAKSLGVSVDDRVVLTMSPAGDAPPVSAAFLVRGIFRTGVTELDASAVQIPLREAQTMLGLGEEVTQVALLLDDERRSEAVAAELASALGATAPGAAQGLEVLSWRQALRELYEAIRIDDMSLYVMMLIVFVIVALGIFNTVLMGVTERTRELGVMMAVGTSRGHVFLLVLVEAAVLAAVSAALGLALGLGLHSVIAKYGIDVAALAGGGEYELAGVTFSGRIYSVLGPATVLRWTLVSASIVLLSAVYPAWRATRLRPVEAMRHV